MQIKSIMTYHYTTIRMIKIQNTDDTKCWKRLEVIETLISGNKLTNLVGDVDNRGGYACVGTGSKWEIFVSSAQYCCDPTDALKKLGMLKKNSKNLAAWASSVPVMIV